MDALTEHGGRLDAAVRRYPHAPAPWIDLSTGINPFAWAVPGELAQIDLRALPSVEALAALEDAARQAFGLVTGRVAALPGSEIGLRLLGGIGLPEPFRHVAPAYRTYVEAVPGGTAVAADAIDDVAGGTLLLANPNNPDGRTIAPERLVAIGRRIAARGGVLVVDEAFADAVPGSSVLPFLNGGDRVIVFRSFGKFFGLAGVRLGFAAGAPDLIGRIADRLGSWPVSTTAIAIGTAAYRDAAWAAAMRPRLAAAAVRRDAVLRAHDLLPVGSCPLFTLVETRRAATLFVRLAQAGILTRPFDDATDRLRFGLPADDAALARLDAALGDG